jgi:uncharacterized membrane protein
LNTFIPSDTREILAPKKRIVFLDVIRAYAIIMMLQGHFVDTMMAPQYRDTNNWFYATWYFFRGMTAPIFFFVSGAIFVFLLLKDNRPWPENQRAKKGLRRVGLLLFLGYVLKWHLPSIMLGVTLVIVSVLKIQMPTVDTLHIYPSFITVDVFHCIGLAILTIIGLFVLHQKTGWSLPLMYGGLGLLIFILAPNIVNADYSHLPVFFENYFDLLHGSTFTVIPWIGYSLLGGVIGWHMHTNPKFYEGPWAPILLLIFGLWLHFSTATILSNFYNLTGIEQFKRVLNFNHTFWRLGHVFVVFAVFIWITRWVQKIPPLILKIGSETLVIYSVHYVLLYGTWLGLGFKQLGQETWSPLMTFFGAIIFISFFIYLIYRIEDVRHVLYVVMPAQSKLFYRFYRLKLRRFTNRPKLIKSFLVSKK